jgi:hypothetical protein
VFCYDLHAHSNRVFTSITSGNGIDSKSGAVGMAIAVGKGMKRAKHQARKRSDATCPDCGERFNSAYGVASLDYAPGHEGDDEYLVDVLLCQRCGRARDRMHGLY